MLDPESGSFQISGSGRSLVAPFSRRAVGRTSINYGTVPQDCVCVCVCVYVVCVTINSLRIPLVSAGPGQSVSNIETSL
jgi:hypothetical protein